MTEPGRNDEDNMPGTDRGRGRGSQQDPVRDVRGYFHVPGEYPERRLPTAR